MTGHLLEWAPIFVGVAVVAACGCPQPGGRRGGGGAPGARAVTDGGPPEAAPGGQGDGAPSAGEPAGPADASPAAVAWTEDVSLDHESHDLPEGAPSAVVHGPAGLDPAAPVQLVVFLHGWTGCVRILARPGRQTCRPGGDLRDGWGLVERHDAAGTDSLFVALQLAYLRRSGRPGRLRREGFFRQQLGELLSGVVSERLGRAVGASDVESITLVAHSAGFESAMTILRRGGVDGLVRNVVLMDALYAGPAIFAEWVAGGAGEGGEARRIVSLYTGRGGTYRGSRFLADHAERLLGPGEVARDPAGDLATTIRAHRVVIARSRHPHADVPARHMAEILPALGLRLRGGADR